MEKCDDNVRCVVGDEQFDFRFELGFEKPAQTFTLRDRDAPVSAAAKNNVSYTSLIRYIIENREELETCLVTRSYSVFLRVLCVSRKWLSNPRITLAAPNNFSQTPFEVLVHIAFHASSKGRCIGRYV